MLSRALRRRAAHPRSRGENVRRSSMTDASDGSSPLTRGKPVDLDEGETKARLIPAHAGKTVHRLSPRADGWAHPRSRGENTL